nr:flagellar assembly protein A [uncultured Desulfobacter sp.]
MGHSENYAILVVDDDEPIVKNIRRILNRKGFTNIVSALNGEQGLKLLESVKVPFFLILSDQQMPGMSGAEFLEKSIMISPESRRMIITGFLDFDTIVDSVNKGAVHQYITKPWDNDDLVLRVIAEKEIYLQQQERKRMFKVTNHQNAKLFELASKLKAVNQKHRQMIREREQSVDALKQSLVKAKAEAEHKEIFLGLDELLSSTITISKENLVQALSVVHKEINLMMERITKRNKVVFSGDPSADVLGDMDDPVYEIIDQIIENVVQAVEPELSDIGSEPDVGVTVDDYDRLPDFGTLAFNDGYITQGELEQAREELEEKETEAATGLTLGEVLGSNGYIRRKDLSRIYAKLALIQMRILDRELGRMLIEKEEATKKDVDRALRKQLNIFEDSGAAFLLGDLLVDAEVISVKVRDEVMASQDRSGKMAADDSTQFSSEFGAFVDLQISEDHTQAHIRVPKAAQGTENIQPIKDLIKKRGITYGIVPDSNIMDFVKACRDPHEQFVVAQGIPVSVGKPAQIRYHFNVEHESAGTIREDGSIDFTSRGDSPFVKKGELLAEKIPMEQARPGRDIFGETLLVDDVDDVPLKGGWGTLISEDGLKLTATIQGQPSLNLKGAVSVLEQFTINGDVDFKTGNINFKGNVLVKGIVKEGFKVECDDLITDEINGGIVRIRGDLKVSNGIINADVQAQGGVQAKFVNNSKIYAYRNMMVVREIMDSWIAVSGNLKNETGRITSSTVAARQGLDLKQIGTEKAEVSTVKAGADDHIQWVALQYDKKMDDINLRLQALIKEKLKHERENNDLHVEIANQTFVQEKITQKMDFTEKKIGKVTGGARQQLAKELKALEKKMAQADDRIKSLFEEQDLALKKIEACDHRIEKENAELAEIKKEKEASIERIQKEPAKALLKINKKVFAGTRIMGTLATSIVKNDTGMCKFMEIDSQYPGIPKILVKKNL